MWVGCSMYHAYVAVAAGRPIRPLHIRVTADGTSSMPPYLFSTPDAKTLTGAPIHSRLACPLPAPPLTPPRRAAHDDAVSAFTCLLGEVVREPFGEWRDWRPRLDKDPLVGVGGTGGGGWRWRWKGIRSTMWINMVDGVGVRAAQRRRQACGGAHGAGYGGVWLWRSVAVFSTFNQVGAGAAAGAAYRRHVRLGRPRVNPLDEALAPCPPFLLTGTTAPLQGRSRSPHLDPREMEELWGRHVAGLMAGLKRGFEDLLDAKLRWGWRGVLVLETTVQASASRRGKSTGMV